MSGLAGPDTGATTRAATAGTHIVWIGGPITAGRDATTTATRMTALASDELGLMVHVYATDDTTASRGLLSRTDDAIVDATYPHADVAYAIICIGLADSIDNLALIITNLRKTLTKTRAAYPNARIVVGACPGSTASMSADQVNGSNTILAAIMGEAKTAGALAVNLRAVCGSDTALQATGIYPNDTGHEALANALVDAIRDDQPEPVDTPITPSRVYSSATTDWASRQVEAVRRREAEKREANRPTGTELGGVTVKLDQLTQAQGVQQVLLELQQDELERQQKAIKAAQDQLKIQQDTLDKQQQALKGVVDDQGDTVSSLKTITDKLDAQQKEISRQAQQLIDMENYRTGALLETLADYEARISALEGR